MTAIREQIFAAIEAALSAGTEAQEIERMPSGEPMSFPALHIFDDGQGPDQQTETYATRYQMGLTIEGFVEGSGGGAMHTALNALYADTVAAIMALGDNSALIEVAEEGDMRTSVVALGSERRLAFSHDFTITYVTRRGDPETN